MIPKRGLKDIRTPGGSLPSKDGCTPLKARTKLLSFQVEKNHLGKEVKRLEERLKTINTRLREINECEAYLYPVASTSTVYLGKGGRSHPGLCSGSEGPHKIRERLMCF